MQKLTRRFSSPSAKTRPAARASGLRLARLLPWARSLKPSRGALATALGFLFVALLGWLNLTTARGLNFESFYLFSCALVGWLAGTQVALGCALVAGVCLYLVEGFGPGAAWPDWVFFWNTLVRLAAFSAIGWLAAQAGRQTRSLKGAVEQNTARLDKEIGEHQETVELLEQALQLFKQLTENITDVFWVTDATKSQVEFVSPAFEEVWGQPCRALYLSPSAWLEAVHHDDRERVTRAVYSKQITGNYDEEYRVVRPDGSVRWVHERAFPVRDQNGAVYRLVGIAEDITERKRTEQLLQAERDVGIALGSTSELRVALNRLLEIALQLEGIDCGGVYLVDPETGELHLEVHRGLSGAFLERISHYKADATETRLAQRGRSLYMREAEIPRTLEVLWGGEGLRGLAVVPIQHQGVVLGMLTLASLRQDGILPRTRVGVEMIASQIAGAIARIQAEESLRRSEAHLRTTINNAPIALLAADAHGRITLEDGHALSAMGAKPGQHLHQSALEVYQEFPLMQENVQRALAGEEFSSLLEFESTTFDCRYAPVRDQAGKPAGFIAVATDVTERVRLQRELLEISDREQARIGQDVHDGLCQQLIGAALKANSLAQSLGSHQHPETPAARKLCGLLDEAITESRRVCRGLYPIRLRQEGLLPALEELARNTTERFQVQCVCEADAHLPRCDVATATHLYRIAQEAVNNALKHSGARTISVQLAGSAEGLVLKIKDDGKGLGPPPLRLSLSSSGGEGRGEEASLLACPDVVQSSVQAGPAPAHGAGMGLHIMDYRARLIGGTLQLQTTSQGTVVSCSVPHLTRSLSL